MKQDNYMSFSIVVGFFMGLVFAIVKFDTPELIVLWTILCTTGVYLIVACCVSFYMMFMEYDSTKLNKDKLDANLEYYLKEFDRREKEVLGIRNYLKRNINVLNDVNEDDNV